MPTTMTATTMTATTMTATTSPDSLLRRPGDYLVVTGGWAAAVIAAAVFPVDHPQVAKAALFLHLMAMAVGFGAVVMIDVYGLLWILGYRTLAELTALWPPPMESSPAGWAACWPAG